MKQVFLRIGSVAGAVTSLVAAPLAMAQTFGIGISSIDDLRAEILCVIASLMFQFLITISVIMIIYAAYLYVTAGDNAEQVRKAHKTILYGAVAVIVAFLASGFPLILQDLFGAGGLPPAC